MRFFNRLLTTEALDWHEGFVNSTPVDVARSTSITRLDLSGMRIALVN